MNRIREWRDAIGITQEDLARLVGTGQSQINKLEKGERCLDKDWLLKLAPALKCRPIDLLSQEELAEYAAIFGTSLRIVNDKYIDVEAIIPKPIAALSSPDNANSQSVISKIKIFGTTRQQGRFSLSSDPIGEIVNRSPANYAVKAFDVSMAPRYLPGQMLYIADREPSAGGGAFIHLTNGAVLVREWVGWDGDGNAAVRAYNPSPSERLLAGDEVEVVHAIVGLDEVT